ncbi:HlyC/CorC family transporter [Candidatus Woesearchaeota archaeon]|nr:HlyC/CorC family transporter [Candidatus Woesearchaeota archaeon]
MIQILILIILLLLSAFFAGVETAFVSLNHLRLQHLVEKRVKGAQLIKQLRDNYEVLITTLLVGNNLVNIAASSLATVVALNLFGTTGVSIAIGVMTFLVLIFGEITPKTVAMAHNESICFKTAPIVNLLTIIMGPIVKLLNGISRLLGRFAKKGRKKLPAITEEEIKSVINLGQSVGEVEEDEKEMIHNIFRFSDMQAHEIMTPKTRVFCIRETDLLKDVMPMIIEQGYSRIPVFNDYPQNITGIVNIKDVLEKLQEGKLHDTVSTIKSETFYVPESMLLDDVLRHFQKQKRHLAVVVDEFGTMSGIITFEDVLEVIVGDIYDESDKEDEQIRKIDKSTYIVRGDTGIEEVNKTCETEFHKDEAYSTIAGLFLEKLQKMPNVGDKIIENNVLLKVNKVDGQKLVSLLLKK